MTSFEHWFLPYAPVATANPANSAKAQPKFSNFSRISSSAADDMNNSEAFAERAAIIEHEAGIPCDWAEAFARVCLMGRPTAIPAEEWQCILDNTGKLLNGHSGDLVRYRWQIADVFGCHPIDPMGNNDKNGLLLLMRENEALVIVNKQSIGLRNIRTGNTLFYRQPLNPNPERVMLWELSCEPD